MRHDSGLETWTQPLLSTAFRWLSWGLALQISVAGRGARQHSFAEEGARSVSLLPSSLSPGGAEDIALSASSWFAKSSLSSLLVAEGEGALYRVRDDSATDALLSLDETDGARKYLRKEGSARNLLNCQLSLVIPSSPSYVENNSTISRFFYDFNVTMLLTPVGSCLYGSGALSVGATLIQSSQGSLCETDGSSCGSSLTLYLNTTGSSYTTTYSFRFIPAPYQCGGVPLLLSGSCPTGSSASLLPTFACQQTRVPLQIVTPVLSALDINIGSTPYLFPLSSALTNFNNYPLSIKKNSSTSWFQITNNQTGAGTFSPLPGAQANGYMLPIVVSVANDPTNTGLVMQPVNVLNRVPTIAAVLIPSQPFGTELNQTLSITGLSSIIADGDGRADICSGPGGSPPCSLTLVNAPSWMSIDSSSGLLSGWPPAPGTYTAQLAVTDLPGAQALTTLSTTFNPSLVVNLNSSLAQFTEDRPLSLAGWLSVSTQANQITISLTPSNTQNSQLQSSTWIAGVSASTSAAGVSTISGAPALVNQYLSGLSLVPKLYYRGSLGIDLEVLDALNQHYSNPSVLFSCIAVNHPVTTAIALASMNGIPTQASSVVTVTNANFNDPDNDGWIVSRVRVMNSHGVELANSVTQPNGWVFTVNQASTQAQVQITPPGGTQGAYTTELDLQWLDATNNPIVGKTLALSTSYSITSSPILIPTQSLGAANVGIPTLFQLLAPTTSDGDPLSDQIIDLPAGWTYNNATKVVSAAATSAQIGPVSFTRVVTDAHGDTATQVYSTTVVQSLMLSLSAQALYQENQAAVSLPPISVNYPGVQLVNVTVKVPELFAAPHIQMSLVAATGITPNINLNSATGNYEWQLRGSQAQVNAYLAAIPISLATDYFGTAQIEVDVDNGVTTVSKFSSATVVHVNQSPEVQAVPAPVSCQFNQPCSATVPLGTFTDPDIATAGDRLTPLVGPLPPGATYNNLTTEYNLGGLPVGRYVLYPGVIDRGALVVNSSWIFDILPLPPAAAFSAANFVQQYGTGLFSVLAVLTPILAATGLWFRRSRAMKISRADLEENLLLLDRYYQAYLAQYGHCKNAEVTHDALRENIDELRQLIALDTVDEKAANSVYILRNQVFLYMAAARVVAETHLTMGLENQIKELIKTLSSMLATALAIKKYNGSEVEVYARLSQILLVFTKLRYTGRALPYPIVDKLAFINDLSTHVGVQQTWAQRLLSSCSSESDPHAALATTAPELKELLRLCLAALSGIEDTDTFFAMLGRTIRRQGGAIKWAPKPDAWANEVDRVQIQASFAAFNGAALNDLCQGYEACPNRSHHVLRAYTDAMDHLLCVYNPERYPEASYQLLRTKIENAFKNRITKLKVVGQVSPPGIRQLALSPRERKGRAVVSRAASSSPRLFIPTMVRTLSPLSPSSGSSQSSKSSTRSTGLATSPDHKAEAPGLPPGVVAALRHQVRVIRESRHSGESDSSLSGTASPAPSFESEPSQERAPLPKVRSSLARLFPAFSPPILAAAGGAGVNEEGGESRVLGFNPMMTRANVSHGV